MTRSPSFCPLAASVLIVLCAQAKLFARTDGMAEPQMDESPAPDEEEQARLVSKAAIEGNAWAMLILGEAYANGRGLMGWHNLHGTFITLALAAGVPFETVAKCTGHTTAKTVRDHYYNPIREHTRQAMKQVGEHVNGKRPASLPAAGADPVAQVAAQLRAMSKADRARLASMLKG